MFSSLGGSGAAAPKPSPANKPGTELGFSGSYDEGTYTGAAGAEEKPNPANSPGGADEAAYDESYVSGAFSFAWLIPERLNPEAPAIFGYGSTGFS